MGQERLGPSYLFISLVLGPLNSLLWYVVVCDIVVVVVVRTFLKVYMELGAYFLFLQEQIKDIIISFRCRFSSFLRSHPIAQFI